MATNLPEVSKQLLDVLEASTCFGIAHDLTAPECKQCDVQAQCKARTEGATIPTPRTKTQTTKTASAKEDKPSTTTKKTASTTSKADKTSTTAAKADKPTKEVSAKMPDFKPMAWEDLVALANKHGVEVKDYNSPAISRMRLIMALKTVDWDNV